jgi:hypothetical protein
MKLKNLTLSYSYSPKYNENGNCQGALSQLAYIPSWRAT